MNTIQDFVELQSGAGDKLNNVRSYHFGVYCNGFKGTKGSVYSRLICLKCKFNKKPLIYLRTFSFY